MEIEFLSVPLLSMEGSDRIFMSQSITGSVLRTVGAFLGHSEHFQYNAQ